MLPARESGSGSRSEWDLEKPGAAGRGEKGDSCILARMGDDRAGLLRLLKLLGPDVEPAWRRLGGSMALAIARCS